MFRPAAKIAAELETQFLPHWQISVQIYIAVGASFSKKETQVFFMTCYVFATSQKVNIKIKYNILRKTRNDPIPWMGYSQVPCLGPRSGPMFGATQWSHAWGHAASYDRNKFYIVFHFQYPSLTKLKINPDQK